MPIALAGNIPLGDAFFNPNLIGNDPGMIDNLLRGAATQRSEEIDTLIVDDLRNALFGPPGAGGIDLASLNIQRGRDVGLPSIVALTRAFGIRSVSNFAQLTSDAALSQALATLYGNDVNRLDVWVGGLAQNHEPDASVGDAFKKIIEDQFRRLRDGDRLFYRGNAAGLYTNGVLNAEIAAIIDLDNVTLADLIIANTSITQLQRNVFFAAAVPEPSSTVLLLTAMYVSLGLIRCRSCSACSMRRS